MLDLTRRSFLAGSGSLVATALLPDFAWATSPEQRPFFTSAENGRRKLLELNRPIIHVPGQNYIDTDFVVSPTFRHESVCAMIYANDREPFAIRNCTFRTIRRSWDPAWAEDVNAYHLTALRFESPTWLVMNGVHIQGMPGAAMELGAVQGAQLRRVSVKRCARGPNFSWPSRNVTAEYLRVWDTWAAAPGLLSGSGASPSVRYPGQWIGGNGFQGYFEDSVFRYFELTGEMHGFKLVRSKRVKVFKLWVPSMMVQGTEGRDANLDGESDGSEDLEFRSLYVDKSAGGSSKSYGANGFQVSWHVSGLNVFDAVFNGGGEDGHAVQMWGDCSGVFRKCVFVGWNGKRGVEPAYAMELGDRSTINADFEVSNAFGDQARILRMAS